MISKFQFLYQFLQCNPHWQQPGIKPREGANALDGLKKSTKKNMSQVRAKFICNLIEESPSFYQKSVQLTAVTSGSDENKSFAKYTPAGNINLTISDDTQAAEFFVKDQEDFIDFTKAE